MYFGCVNKFAQHVYFLANLKYANELLKHMSHGHICTCPPCLSQIGFATQLRCATIEELLPDYRVIPIPEYEFKGGLMYPQ